MTVIPKSERETAKATLNDVRQWLGAQDYRDIARQLGNLTEGTVRQVAKGERWNMDAYTALLNVGRAKAAKFAATLDGTGKTTSKATQTTDEAPKPVKSPKKAPAEIIAPAPVDEVAKPKPTKKPKRIADPLPTA